MSATATAITIVQGEAHTLQWTITNSAGATVNVSSYTATLRLSKDNATTVAEFTGDATSFGASGIVVFDLLNADTAAIAEGMYSYQVWLRISASKSNVVARGTLTIAAAIEAL